jgi:hypothetical protein
MPGLPAGISLSLKFQFCSHMTLVLSSEDDANQIQFGHGRCLVVTSLSFQASGLGLAVTESLHQVAWQVYGFVGEQSQSLRCIVL